MNVRVWMSSVHRAMMRAVGVLSSQLHRARSESPLQRGCEDEPESSAQDRGNKPLVDDPGGPDASEDVVEHTECGGQHSSRHKERIHSQVAEQNKPWLEDCGYDFTHCPTWTSLAG